MLDKALSVAAAKAKVAGLVVAAAAAVGGTAAVVGTDSFVPTAGEAAAPPSLPSPTGTPAASPTATVDPAATPAPTDPASPAASAFPCPTDVANHGQYVSSVAHDKTFKGRLHGLAVSIAAQSSCGTPTPGASDAADLEESAESPEPEESPEPAESPRGAAPQGQGHGQGHHGRH